MRPPLLLLLGAVACPTAGGDEACEASSQAPGGCAEGGDAGADAAGAPGVARVLPYGAVAAPRFPAPHYARDAGRLAGEDLRVEVLGVGQAARVCAQIGPECRGFTFAGAPREDLVGSFKIHFKGGSGLLRFRPEDGSDKWTSFRRQRLPPPKCPLFTLDHLFKAGGNAARALLGRLGLHSEMMATGAKITVTSAGEGAVAIGAHADLGDRGDLPTFRVGMVRSPCDYLLSVWSFQRVPSQPRVRCAHSEDICRCLDLHRPAGSAAQDFLPAFRPGRRAMEGQAHRFAEGELASTLEEDRGRFGRWLRVMAGDSGLLLLSTRLYRLTKSGLRGQTRADCPLELNQSEVRTVREAVAREASPDRHFACTLRTESLRADVGRCALAWARACDEDTRGAMETYIRQGLEAESWQLPVDNRSLNAGSHESCRSFISERDQAFIWEREAHVAEVYGYKTCCS